MFFALSNALLDTSIPVWDIKRAYDSMRPATEIPLLYHDKRIHAWGGPGKGLVDMNGSQWIPYQEATLPTPSSPDYVSAQGAFKHGCRFNPGRLDGKRWVRILSSYRARQLED
jgi:hypothetical protein